MPRTNLGDIAPTPSQIVRSLSVLALSTLVACSSGANEAPSPQVPSQVRPTPTIAQSELPPLQLVGEVPQNDQSLIQYTPEQIAQITPLLEEIANSFPPNSVEYYMATSALGRPNAPKYAVLPNGTKVLLGGNALNQTGTTNASSNVTLVKDNNGGDVIIMTSLNVPLVDALSARRSNKSLAPVEWQALFLKEAVGNVYAYDEVFKDRFGLIERLAAANMPANGSPIPQYVHPQIQQLRNIRSWAANPDPDQTSLLDVFTPEFIYFGDILATSYHPAFTQRAYPNRALPKHRYGESITPQLILEVFGTAYDGTVIQETAQVGLPNAAYGLGGITITYP